MVDGHIITIDKLESYHQKIQEVINNGYNTLNNKIYIGTKSQYETDKNSVPDGAIVIITDDEEVSEEV